MSPSKKQSRPEAIATRDATFHRAVADKVLSFDLGRDVEIAFLQGGPVIQKIIDVDENSEQVQLTGSLTEVVRVRLSTPTALSLAVSLMTTLVESGRVKVPALREAILKILSDSDTSDGPE